MNGLLFEHKLPCLTFYADNLENCLKNHPEVNMLILNAWFPISEEETSMLESWLEKSPGRKVIYLGGDYGYTYSLETSIYQWDKRRGPEMLALFGADPLSIKPFRRDDRITLEKVSNQTEFNLGNEITLKTSGIGKINFTDETVEILYKDKYSGSPVITKRKVGKGEAWYVGISLDGSELGEMASKGCSPFPLKELILKNQVDDEYPLVLEAASGVLWNRTQAGFLILSNTWETSAKIKLRKTKNNYWNCKTGAWVENEEIEIEPLDFAVLRIVPENSPLLDILEVCSITKLVEKGNHLRIEGTFFPDFCLVSLAAPEEMIFNDVSINWETESIEQGWGIQPRFKTCTDGVLQIKWSLEE